MGIASFIHKRTIYVWIFWNMYDLKSPIMFWVIGVVSYLGSLFLPDEILTVDKIER